MKRFTYKSSEGRYEIGAYTGYIHSAVAYDGIDDEEFFWGEPIDRLGQYEDLGYTPRQLKTIIKRYEQLKPKES